tara:strand:- start:763 stop:1119 length:357 start_codon:yes stop_codon:yes gene_type:complete
MIIQGNELSVFDLMEYYANRNQCHLLYMDLSKYNTLDASKKATVNTWYQDFIDEYALDIIKQGVYTTIRFDSEEVATLNAASWFPRLADCPDSDHFINAYVVDTYGDIVWQNVPENPS